MPGVWFCGIRPPLGWFYRLANHPFKRPRSWATRAASFFGSTWTTWTTRTTYSADLPADGVFLLIERFLLGGRDVAVVELRHRPLFLADRPILAVKLAGLAFADFAFPHLVIDAPILILQTIVDLGASRVILLPLCLGHGVRHGDAG